jgi:hypothetical protein
MSVENEPGPPRRRRTLSYVRSKALRAVGMAGIAFIIGALAAADWPTYHGDNTRQGDDTSDPGLASAEVAWTSPQLDGSIYGQPVVVGTQVVVATENNTVYSLVASDGAVIWSTHLGPPRTASFACGNINPLGITGTPTIDGGSVFVVAEIQMSPTTFVFDLVSLDLSSGAVKWTHSLAPSDSQWSVVAPYQQQRGALLAIDGRVIVPMGGLAGDCGTYHGYVLSYPETGIGSVTWWASSEVKPGDNQGSIWAAGGLSADANGYIYASTGNSNQVTAGSTYDYGDSVVKLNPTGLAPGGPVDYFAPATWYQDNAADADLGSTTPLQLPNGRIFIVGKTGVGYLLSTTSLGHVGGAITQHAVCHATQDAAFGSLAYSNGEVYVGCSDGMVDVHINPSNTDFSTAWYNTTDVADHPPTVAGGLVWSMSPDSSSLVAFDVNTGQHVNTFSVGPATHFTTPTAANGQLYVAAGARVHAFASCAGSWILGDFTGDGNAALAGVSRSGTCVMASTGSGFSAPIPWATLPFFGGRVTLAADLNGDHRADLVAINDASVWVMLSSGSGFSAPQEWSTVPFFGTVATLSGDVNGDGRDDLIAVNANSTWVMLSTGSGFSRPQLWSTARFFGSRGTFAVDLNHSGRLSLLAVDGDSTWVMVNSGSGFSSPQRWSSVPFYGSIATLAGDVSADGRADVIAVDADSTWVMVNTGSAFSAPQLWSTTPFYGIHATLAGDVNHDQSTDLVAVDGDSVWAMLSTGTAFARPALWWTGPP